MRDVPSLVLGVDLGTTNTKVALAAVDGSAVRVKAVATAPTPSPDRLGATLEQLIAHAAGGASPEAVGIASMAETGVPLDAGGRPVGDWLRWDGARAGDDADQLAARLGWAELVRATGTRPSAKVPLVAWRWLRRTDPYRFAALYRWAGVADLAALALTGELATDHTLAARTMAYRRPGPGGRVAHGFDADLLAEVGLRPEQLPAVTNGIAGRATGVAGLRPGTPVTIAGHDHAVGAYAAGAREPGQVADSVGTAEALLSVVASAPDPVAVARAGMSSVVTVDGRHPALLAGSPTAGRFVEWWLAEEGLSPDVFATAEPTTDPEPLLVLPYLRGRQTPTPDPSATVRVLGAERGPARLDPARRARAMLQGLCLHAEWIRREQARLAGLDPGDLAVLGGPLAANPAWLRLKAAVSGPLWLITEAEAVATGAALLAAVRAGLVEPPGPVLAARAVPPPDPRPDYAPTLAAFVAAATEAPATGDVR